jgi:hypothetical protein
MTYDGITRIEHKLNNAKNDYLRQHGWSQTSSTPGCYWMWRRSFADVNQRRLEEHQAFCARIKEERRHDPYPAEMLVDTDTAVRMTWAEIDPKRLEIEEDD